MSKTNHIAAASAALLLLCTTACDDTKSDASASSSARPTAAKSAAPTSSADAVAKAATTATASPAVEAPKPSFDLFSGAPEFEGKAKPIARTGVSFDVPPGYQSWDLMREDKLILGFDNPPKTAKGMLFFKSGEDMNTWASAATLAKSQTEKVARGGALTLCEESVFKATNVHHTKVVWVGEPKDATFGAAKLPGSVIEAKDPKDKWKIYCLRIAITDKAAVYGAVGWRIDKKDSEASAKAVSNVLKSFRPEGS